MKKSLRCAVVLAVGALVLPGSAWAHHGDANRYIEEVSTVTGTLVQLVLVNPHTLIMFDVTENGKTTRWTAELRTPQELAKTYGWTPTTIKVGSRITATGRAAKSGSPYMSLTERANLVLTDSGKEIYRTPNFGDPTPGPNGLPPASK